MDPEPPQFCSEVEISHSDRDDQHFGTHEQENLLMAQEEIEDNDSFTSPVVTRAPLWKFAEQIPSLALRLGLNLRLQLLRLSL